MRIKPFKIVMIYLVASLVWIMIGPYLVNGISDMFSISDGNVELLKGIFFVLFTAVVLYFTILAQQRLLSASEKHYKNLFYVNPIPLFICDQHHLGIMEVNHAAVKLYGYTVEEFKRMTVHDLAVDKQAISGEQLTGHWKMQKRNGDEMITQVNSHLMELMEMNGKQGILIITEDITEAIRRKETLKLLYATERELKEELEQNIKLIEQSLAEKQRMAEVIDRVHNMVVITDPQGIITWVNTAFTSITGYTFDEAVGRFPNFLHGPETDPNKQDEIMSAIKQHDFTSFDILNYKKSGEKYWAGITVSAVYNEQHEIVRYISIETVITDRVLTDEKLRKQNEILMKLAWTNSHAIRKPVVSILSLVELCKETFDIAELKKFNALIETCARELDDITKEVGKEINENDTIS